LNRNLTKDKQILAYDFKNFRGMNLYDIVNRKLMIDFCNFQKNASIHL